MNELFVKPLGRFVALFITITLILPNPAFAFRPEAKQEGAQTGLEEIAAALASDVPSVSTTAPAQNPSLPSALPQSPRRAGLEEDGEGRITWNDGRKLRIITLSGHGGEVFAVAFSPDGTKVVTASGDGTVMLWDAATGKEIATLSGHDDSVYTVAFSRDGKRVATGSQDGTVILWDAKTWKKTATLSGHTGAVYTVAFSSDGTKMATGSSDETAILWDAKTWKKIATLPDHDDAVYTVAFSPDGTQVATGSRDKTAKLWDATTGTEIATLSGHTGVVYTVAFSSDGRQVVTGSSDKRVMLWDITRSAAGLEEDGEGQGPAMMRREFLRKTAAISAGVAAATPAVSMSETQVSDPFSEALRKGPVFSNGFTYSVEGTVSVLPGQAIQAGNLQPGKVGVSFIVGESGEAVSRKETAPQPVALKLFHQGLIPQGFSLPPGVSAYPVGKDLPGFQRDQVEGRIPRITKQDVFIGDAEFMTPEELRKWLPAEVNPASILITKGMFNNLTTEGGNRALEQLILAAQQAQSQGLILHVNDVRFTTHGNYRIAVLTAA